MPDIPVDPEPSWLDERAARRRFARAAASAASVDALAREVEQRMAERLDLVRIAPERILDAGSGVGASRSLLEGRYPKAAIVAIDSAWAVLRQADARLPLARRTLRWVRGERAQAVCADFAALPFAPRSFSMVWSNLALAWAPEPAEVFAELHRVLAPGGLVMFSSYGPDTLKELRAAFSVVDSRPHVHRFVDMHDLGDMLVASGFVAPVMDMELFTLTFEDFDALARDLRLSGQTNALRERSRGLMGRHAYSRLRESYALARRDGKLPATFEVIYGHAWRGEPRKTRDGRSIVQLEMPSRS